MKIAILCLLLVPFLHGATIQETSIDRARSSQTQPLGRSRRFIFDDDDYDYWFGRGPSRQTIRLARMIEQLTGSRGLNQRQLLNMLRDLLNLQALSNMGNLGNLQQLLQQQNLQTIPNLTNLQQLIQQQNSQTLPNMNNLQQLSQQQNTQTMPPQMIG